MDRRERVENLHSLLLAAGDSFRSEMWTALPGIIQSFDPSAMTCEVQPTIQAKQVSPVDGAVKWVSLPVLLDCPVFYPSGGGCTLTFPLKEGDECLVIFASRCIDAWWNSGSVDRQNILRMHDLSDGFVFAGVRSRPRFLSGVSTNSAQLRTDDGAAYVELTSAGHVCNIVAPGGINITGPTVFAGTVTANGHRIDETHEHSGVISGGSNTGPVT